MKAHDDPELKQNFQVIRTKTGRNLTLTNTHLIYKVEIDEPNQELNEVISSDPVLAMKIRKGDFVLVNDENKGMIKDEVVSNDIVIRKGIFAPITANGKIVVDDILASCYTHYKHSFLHMVFAPFRWYHDAKHLLSSVKKMESHGSSEQKKLQREIHWYPGTLLTIMESIFPNCELLDY